MNKSMVYGLGSLAGINTGSSYPGENNNPNHKYVGVRTEPKIGRNSMCPCGSDVKYKKCCMNKDVGK